MPLLGCVWGPATGSLGVIMPSVFIPASKAVHEMLAAMHLLFQATSLCPHLVFWKYRQSPKQKHM